jgi:hypothetical protein
MSLEDWANNRWLRPHKTSPKEIADLLGIVERDLADAGGNISADWRFGIAYNGALKLCAILLHASGYRAENAQQHYRTIDAMPKILGKEKQGDADYLNVCRSKRNITEYEHTGGVTEADAAELAEFARELRTDVLKWLKQNHPNLVPKERA